MNITKITVKNLETLLMGITKSMVCSISYITDHAQSKTLNGCKVLQKAVKVNNLYLNHNYTKKVQNLTGDTSFESFEMKGKTRLSSTLIQSDKTGNILLDGKILNKESVELLGLYHNGDEITMDKAKELDLFTPAFYKPKETITAGRGLVSEEDDFKMITVSLVNLLTIKIGGIQYIVKD